MLSLLSEFLVEILPSPAHTSNAAVSLELLEKHKQQQQYIVVSDLIIITTADIFQGNCCVRKNKPKAQKEQYLPTRQRRV